MTDWARLHVVSRGEPDFQVVSWDVPFPQFYDSEPSVRSFITYGTLTEVHNRMLRYDPIQAPIPIQASLSGLVQSQWRNYELWADFRITNDAERFLRVHFRRAEVVRVLDEMPLSTEEAGQAIGLKPEHFAYVVEGAPFWFSLSGAFRDTTRSARHYRFVTGWACMDVVSKGEPDFQVVKGDAPFPAISR